MQINDYIKKIQSEEVEFKTCKIEGLVNDSIQVLLFVVNKVLDDDKQELKNNAIGWAFVDFIQKNKIVELENEHEELLRLKFDRVGDDWNKRKIIEDLLRICSIINQDHTYDNSIILMLIRTLKSLCDFYNLDLCQCIEIELEKTGGK